MKRMLHSGKRGPVPTVLRCVAASMYVLKMYVFFVLSWIKFVLWDLQITAILCFNFTLHPIFFRSRSVYLKKTKKTARQTPMYCYHLRDYPLIKMARWELSVTRSLWNVNKGDRNTIALTLFISFFARHEIAAMVCFPHISSLHIRWP